MAKVPDELYRWSVKEIAQVCEVDLSTARRWKRGATCPPRTALALLSRDLGYIDPAWRGWTLVNGQLVSPEKWIATPGDVLSIQLTQAQLSTYRAENRGLKAALAAAEAGFYEEQPLPTQWSLSTG